MEDRNRIVILVEPHRIRITKICTLYAYGGKYSLLVFTILLLLMGCNPVSTAKVEMEGVTMTIQLISPAFSEGGTIPKKFTCDAENVSPQLDWSDIPIGTQSLVLIADDPDAPAGTWVHWVLYDLPPELTGLAEGAQGIGVDGVNDFRKLGYGGPCPPRGSNHRYLFKLYALDMKLNIKPGSSKSDVERVMKGHILALGQLMGRYGR
jgi:Raf kinase inhibitor-like YbhB/YbcL family protein